MVEAAGKKIAGNTVAQVISKVVTVATSLLIIALITRYLGVAGYGDYATIMAYVGIFTVFVDLGFFMITLRRISSNPEERNALVSNAFTIKVSLGLLVFLGAYALSFLFPYSYVLRIGIVIAGASHLFMSLSNIVISILQADLEMYKAATSDVLGRITNLAVVWMVIQSGGGLWLILAAALAGNLALFGLNWYWVRAKTDIGFAFDFAVWKDLFWEALPLGIVLILAMIYFRIDTIMLSVMKGSEDVGIYSPPYKVLDVILTLPTIFMTNVFPVFVERLEDAKEKARKLFQKAFDILSMLAMPLIAGAIVFAGPIMLIIAGGDFTQSDSVLRILSWSIAGSFLNSVMIYSLIASGHHKKLLWPYIGTAVFNVVLNYILIPEYTYIGASYATIATEVLVLIYSTWLVYNVLDMTPRIEILIKSVLAAFVMFASLWFLDLSLWWGVPAGVGIYAGVLYLVGGLKKDMLRHLIPEL